LFLKIKSVVPLGLLLGILFIAGLKTRR